MTNSLNLQEINQEIALDLASFYIRSSKNMLMLGRPGIGKTQIAMQSAINCGYRLNYINLAVLERPDLAGFPRLNDNSDVVNYKSPYYLPLLKDNEEPNIVILFDEVDKCNPELTAPLLEILDLKSINGRKINCISCILTGNLPGDRTFSNSISTALLDRCAKYVLTFDFNKWMVWAKSDKGQIHDLILGFLSSNQNMVCGEIDDVCYGAPTPRGWTQASQAIIQAYKNKITDVDTITSIVAGFVGQTAAISFAQYYTYSRHYEKVIIDLIETGFCDIEYHTLEPTQQLVFAIMACYTAKNKILDGSGKKRLKHLDYLCQFFTEKNVPQEMQLISMGNAFSFDFIVKEKLFECKPFLKLHTELMDSVGDAE